VPLPVPTTRATTCPLDCPDACGILVESDDSGKLVRLRGNPAHSASRGTLCGKTMLYGELVSSPDRLLRPLVRAGGRKSGALVEATWAEALDLVAERVAPLRGEDVLALWYGGTMGLVQRRFPLRAMNALGATLHDGGICDSASTAGYECVLGRCIGPDVETIEDADLVLLWGCDASRTAQHLQPALQRLCRRGVPVVALDVYRSDTIRALERWGGRGIVLAPGSDAALALCLARIAFEIGFADREFLASQCLGAEEFEIHVRARHDLEETSAVTGVPSQEIADLAGLIQRAHAPFLKVGVGWTRRRNGAMGMRAVCSLAAVVGAAHRVHYESFAHFDLAEGVVRRDDLRPKSAPTVPVVQVALGRELAAGRYRAAFVWCHNPAVTLPDSIAVRRGLAREDLFLVVHEHFLTETAELADVVLPATMFVEHADVYRSYGHRLMQYARRAVEPPDGPRSNVAAFGAIAKRLGLPKETWEPTEEELCEELLEASRSRIGDAEMARLRAGEPVKLAPRELVGWGTPSGKVELWSEAARAKGQPAMATYVEDDGAGDRGRFVLVPAPSIATHNSTYAHSPRHVKKAGPPRLFVNPDDAREIGLAEGAKARISNARGALTMPAVLSAEMPRGLVRVDGMPRARDLPEKVGINALVSGATSDLGDGNVLYSTRVDVAPAG
jgi:anaerobic selenocysteine-containing dehydrogenase